VRKALKTLPWVEEGTIKMEFKTRELTFGLKDKSHFKEEDLKKALKDQGFPNAEVRAGPA
jgi:hypothetical protein